VSVWDAVTGERVSSFPHSHGSVRGLLFAEDNKLVLVPSPNEGVIEIFELSSRKSLRTLKLPDPQIQSLAGGLPVVVLSPDSSKVAAVGRSHDPANTSDPHPSGTLTVWEVRSGKRLWSVDGTRARTLAFTGDGRLLAATGHRAVAVPPAPGNSGGTRFDECHLTAWNATTGRQHSRIDRNYSTPDRLLAKPGGSTCLILEGGTGRWVDVDKAALGRQVFPPLPQIQLAPSLSSDGRNLHLTTRGAGPGNVLMVIDLATSRPIRTMKLSPLALMGIPPVISPSSDRVLLAGRDGIRIDGF
jgi:hypothetical protein